jgi:hypothetical protein
MHAKIARAATAAITLAMAGGAGLTTATHAAAATTSYTCKGLLFAATPPPRPGIPKIQPDLLGTGCNVPGSGHESGSGKTVTGQVDGWANPRSFRYTDSICPSHGTCTFTRPVLLPSNNHTCASLVLLPVNPMNLSKKPALTGVECDITGTGEGSGKGQTVTGQVIGWANPRSFTYSRSVCLAGLDCTFLDTTLLQKS